MSGLKDILSFTEDWVKETVNAVKKKPSRLITGVDPIPTQVWNKIKGSNDKAIVNVTGGPTEESKNNLNAGGAARTWYQVADTIAAMWGMGGAAGAIGKGLGVSANTAGQGLKTGSGLVGDKGISFDGLGQSATESTSSQSQSSGNGPMAEDSLLAKYIKDSLLGFENSNTALQQFDLLGKDQKNV